MAAAPYFEDAVTRVFHGDCTAIMPELGAESVDAVVTDPPYHLIETTKRFATGQAPRVTTGAPAVYQRHSRGFMGQTWDGGDVAFQAETWAKALRVLKPGGHLVAFGGSRTYHRLACAIEDAGFEIRDTVAWLYGQGFPKSLDVGKAIDKMAGAEREVVGTEVRRDIRNGPGRTRGGGVHAAVRGAAEYVELAVTAPATAEAKEWQGWGTALKPAMELICVARKPLAEKNVAANVLAYGVGAINVDGCRIATDGELIHAPQSDPAKRRGTVGADLGISKADPARFQQAQRESVERTNTLGRWPANVTLGHSDGCVEVGTVTVLSDGHYPAARGSGGVGTSGHGGQRGLEERSTAGEAVAVWECVEECAVRLLDEQSGDRTSGGAAPGGHWRHEPPGVGVYGGGRGLWSDAGPPGQLYGDSGGASRFFFTAKASSAERQGLTHPTVKPVALMRWLCRLVTPPGGVVLDPFAGTGTTRLAALAEGFTTVLIEQNEEYLAQLCGRAAQLSLLGA